MKKYQLTDECNVQGLHRIKALIDGPWGKAGTSGGWIASESNLSQENTCWVYGAAQVYGAAWVSDTARVFGNAWVYGAAQVYEDAQITKQQDWIMMGPIGSRDATLTAYRTATGSVAVATGCFFGSVAEFLAAVDHAHGTNQYAREYRQAVALIQMHLSSEDKGE